MSASTEVITADIAVVGAGILGCMVARELSRSKLEVVVLERYGDVGDGSTTANSGIIHTGFHARGGSLKGTSCVEGNALFMSGLAAELGVTLVPCGGMMVAFKDAGLEKLAEKRERAQKNGAGELRVIDGDEARALEPRLSPEVIAALSAPSTSIISPFELIYQTAKNALRNGVRFEFNAQVETLEKQGQHWLLNCASGLKVRVRAVFNLAGDDAALLDSKVRPHDVVVRPKLGQYLVFDKQGHDALRHVIFQAGDDDEGGTLLAPTVDGNLLAGPTSDTIRSWRENRTTSAGIEHIRKVAQKVIPDIDFSQVITNFSGVRANITSLDKEHKDFLLRETAEGFISALGIKNPGMTASPALAKRAVALLERSGWVLEQNPGFDPVEPPNPPFIRCDAVTQRSLLEENPAYGRVICRCEHITEGDVRAVCAGPLPPHTLDGVKRRLRTGMGRCQGAFCMPRVVDLLAAGEGARLRGDVSRVAKSELGGYAVARKVK